MESLLGQKKPYLPESQKQFVSTKTFKMLLQLSKVFCVCVWLMSGKLAQLAGC